MYESFCVVVVVCARERHATHLLQHNPGVCYMHTASMYKKRIMLCVAAHAIKMNSQEDMTGNGDAQKTRTRHSVPPSTQEHTHHPHNTTTTNPALHPWITHSPDAPRATKASFSSSSHRPPPPPLPPPPPPRSPHQQHPCAPCPCPSHVLSHAPCHHHGPLYQQQGACCPHETLWCLFLWDEGG